MEGRVGGMTETSELMTVYVSRNEVHQSCLQKKVVRVVGGKILQSTCAETGACKEAKLNEIRVVGGGTHHRLQLSPYNC